MKYLLILVMVAVVLWLWRSRRPDSDNGEGDSAPSRRSAAQPRRPELPPAEMVACAVCDLHLPRSEALPGPGGQGLYCSEAHRRQAGKT